MPPAFKGIVMRERYPPPRYYHTGRAHIRLCRQRQRGPLDSRCTALKRASHCRSIRVLVRLELPRYVHFRRFSQTDGLTLWRRRRRRRRRESRGRGQQHFLPIQIFLAMVSGERTAGKRRNICTRTNRGTVLHLDTKSARESRGRQ